MALAHGSTDLPMACRVLRVPNTTMFDYEFAALQHSLNCRLATRVLVPDAIPPGRLRRFGVRPPQARALPGPQGGVLPGRFRGRPGGARARSGLDGERIGLVLRPPADVALYHRFANPLFDARARPDRADATT